MSRYPREQFEGTQRGYWFVLEYLGDSTYRCRCACGVKRDISAQSLKYGRSSSCGCMANALRQENAVKFEQRHAPVTERVEPDYIKEPVWNAPTR